MIGFYCYIYYHINVDKVIYIIGGTAVTFLNMINAGCCGNKFENKSYGLADVKFKYGGVDLKKCDELFKNRYDSFVKEVGGFFRFNSDDISKNVRFFSSGSADLTYVCVFTKELYEKQDQNIMKKCAQKLSELCPYYVIFIKTAGDMQIIPQDSSETLFILEVDRSDNSQFIIARDKKLS